MIATRQRDSRAPLFKKAEYYIRELIVQGDLQPGDLIPGRKALAKELGMNELTVRRAVTNLIDRNVLAAQRGKGTYVAEENSKPRILWVCGDDIFGGDLSPFYSNLLRFSRTACRNNGLAVEPVFRPNITAHLANEADHRNLTKGCDGFVFVACNEDHSFLAYVQRNNLPYGCTTVQPGKPHSVSNDPVRALELAADHFRQRSVERVHVFMAHDWLVDPKPIFERMGLHVVPVVHGIFQRMSDGEAEGYRVMHGLLAGTTMPEAFYIPDDIFARGATRAILETGLQRNHPIEIVVRCGRQEILPLGLPVTFLAHDTEEMAKAAVNMVVDQIAGRRPQPFFYVSQPQFFPSLNYPGHGLAPTDEPRRARELAYV